MRPQRSVPESDFKVPPPSKKMKMGVPERAPYLHPDVEERIMQEREFNSEYLYEMHDTIEKAIMVNADQRMKYQDEPERFFESEVELHQLIGKMTHISAYP